MRKTYQYILKIYFNHNLVQTCTILQLTQAQMAELLSMGDRFYIDLDHGKSCGSAVTLALYLPFICDDVLKFVEGLRYAFDDGKNSAA